MKTLREVGSHIQFILADVSKSDEVQRLINETVSLYGKLDIASIMQALKGTLFLSKKRRNCNVLALVQAANLSSLTSHPVLNIIDIFKLCNLLFVFDLNYKWSIGLWSTALLSLSSGMNVLQAISRMLPSTSSK